MSKNNPQTEEERQEKFIAELTKLTKKYGIAIGGCGCCGSPWVTPTNIKDGHYEHSGYDGLSYVENK